MLKFSALQHWLQSASLDGFRPEHAQPFVAFNPETARRFYAGLGRLAQHLDVRVEGLEHIPPGRALIVANHSFGWDVLFVMAAIHNQLGRPVWALGEHLWWKFPYVRRLAAAVGTVDGTPENVAALLDHDELVLVQPGGLREALKPRELRYRLLWGKRQGFVRAAIASQAPILPLAAVGGDELFSLLGNAYQRGERWLHRRGVPIPLPSRILPIPHFVPWRFSVGELIPARFAREQANDPAALRQLRHEVEGALHELLEVELARRAGIDLPLL